MTAVQDGKKALLKKLQNEFKELMDHDIIIWNEHREKMERFSKLLFAYHAETAEHGEEEEEELTATQPLDDEEPPKRKEEKKKKHKKKPYDKLVKPRVMKKEPE